MSESPIDPSVLSSLESSTDAAFVQELLQTYLEDSASLVSAIRKGLADGAASAVRLASHSLKSNSATVGAPRLSALAGELEAMAKADQLSGGAASLEALAAEFDRVQATLRTWPHAN
jgi:HPt (histidine-containing phosphotransfer) domain-containing protein